MNSLVLNACHQTTLRRFLAWILVTTGIFAGGLTLCVQNIRYIQNFLDGPYHMDENDLHGIKNLDAAPRIFVTISGSRAVETSVQEVEVRNGSETNNRATAAYYALLVGDHWLIVKTDIGVRTTIEGSLETISSDLRDNFFSTAKDRQVEDQFYPFYVDATGSAFKLPSGRLLSISTYRLYGWLGSVGIAFMAVVLTYLFFHMTRPLLRRLKDPMVHPILQRMHEWCDHISISTEIERELQFRAEIKQGRFTFTNKYLVEKSFFRFDVFRFEDLLWAYKHVTVRRVYGVIPIGRKYRSFLKFYGGGAEIPAREKDVDAILLYSANKAPWAVIGYSKELSDLFRTNLRDFCLAVEARRHATRP